MSNIIPFVSSSPPPMDPDQTVDWEEDEDEDDDFGNFASFKSTAVEEDVEGGKDGFVADWSDAGFKSGTKATEKESGDISPENHIVQNAEETVPPDEISSKPSAVVEDKEEFGSGGADADEDDDDFADFAGFQSGTNSVDKPHLDALPLKTTHQQRLEEEDAEGDMGVAKGTESVMEKSRESTATDSGLFSNDMSPLPQSESMCISEGDKSTTHSDDETFSDIPQDSQSQTLSHHEPDQRPAHPDVGGEEDSQCEDSHTLQDKEPSRQSDTRTPSPEHNGAEKAVEYEAAETIENEEVGSDADKTDNEKIINDADIDNKKDSEEIISDADVKRDSEEILSDVDKQDSADGSLSQSEQSRSTSPAVNSVEGECHDQQELSSTPEPGNSTPERNGETERSPAKTNSAIEGEEHIPQSNTDLRTSAVTQEPGGGIPTNAKSSHEANGVEDNAAADDDDDNWAAFESPPSSLTETEKDTGGQREEPEDLMLRKDSVNADDDEDVSGASMEEDVSGASMEEVAGEDKKLARKPEEEGGAEDGRKPDSAMTMPSSDEDAERCEEDVPQDQTDADSGSGVHTQAGSAHSEAPSADAAGADESSDLPSTPPPPGDYQQISADESSPLPSTPPPPGDYQQISADESSDLPSTPPPPGDYQQISADESSHLPSTPPPQGDYQQISAVKAGDENSCSEDEDFGDFRGEAVPTQTTPPPENGTPTSEDGQDVAQRSSSAEPALENTEEDFGDFSSTRASAGVGGDVDVDVDDDDDDFGDFNTGSLSSAGTVTKPDTDDFGAFSNKSVDTATGEGDDFGDFSGQPKAESSGSGWADFGEPAKPSKPDDDGDDDDDNDFGNFSASDSKAAPASDSFSEVSAAPVHASLPSSDASSSSQNVRAKTIETALMSCFSLPESTQQQQQQPVSGAASNSAAGSVEPQQPRDDGESSVSESGTVTGSDGDTDSSGPDKLGVLETILEYGLQYRSACQQTWQVVQHPSRRDPRVKLWGLLQDMDGSPAVIYQWAKSKTNSHVFHTLHIDTQNMLIGHKKRSVPIFATGLSLLEPIRGGRKEREGGGSTQPDHNSMASMLSPTQVDSTPQETERRAQDIPAVDFDWSTSGLTNPLTSHSLDLDFLVAQDSHSSDKPSVFQSELLDAPRSSVKPSHQPLEAIMQSVRPTTSVRGRRRWEDAAAATSHMSPEALRVLGNLTDLTFMQSKVLMFPIKN